MRRIALLSTLLLAVLTAAIAGVAGQATGAATRAKLTYGISDQQAKTFLNPKFRALNLRIARYIAPYDVMTDADQRGRLDAWVRAAVADGQRILVSFEHSRTPGREARMPSVAEYTAELQKFKAVYGPFVKDISPWNEVNVCQKNGRTEGQPVRICRDPKVAAKIYRAGRKVFPKHRIVVLDFLDGNSHAAAMKYVKGFIKAAKPGPKAIWGLHNYSDTNRYDDRKKRTREILKTIGRGEVWLTETGGQVTFKKRSVAEGAPFAAKALGCMFHIAKKYKQITRVYIYSFNGTPENVGLLFDSGLVADDGVTERPGYAVVRQRQSIRCDK